MSARRFVLALLGAIPCAAAPGFATAHVLEVDENGVVTVYDGPARHFVDGSEVLVVSPSISTNSVPPVALSIGLPPALVQAADGEALSPALIEAVAWQESRLRSGVISRAGAIGEMQLMPETARALGVDPHDTAQNYRGGTRYLAQMLKRYDGDLVRALAAYNAGPRAVDRYGGVPPFRETRDYVAAILNRLGAQVLR